MTKRNTTPASAYLRLLMGAVSAGLAALSVVEPQNWNMVVLTIGVTEWGHVVATLGLAPLLPGWRRERAALIGGLLGLAATTLAISPLLRATQIGQRLPARLAAAFGDAAPRSLPGAPPRPAPLVVRDVLHGVQLSPVRKDRMTYVDRDGLALALDLYRPDNGRRTTDDDQDLGLGTRDVGLAADGDAQAPSPKPQAPSPKPQGAYGPAPCVVVVHGGAWRSGDCEQLPALNGYLAARGYVVAAINYRLLPDHPFPAGRDDVLAAIDYLKANAGDMGVDPQRIVLLGRSAGGQLALLVAYTANDPAIRGAIAFYPPTDLVYGYYHPAKKEIIDGILVIESYLGGSPTSAPDAYAAAAPISFAGAGCPPTLLIHGGRDNLVAPVQSERLAARLAAAGCRHLYLSLPWAHHACDANFSGPSGQISTYAIERFLAAATR
ncbi:MAG TPA: alpha/beta hydrolase [Roseiflexaceae bacterium]